MTACGGGSYYVTIEKEGNLTVIDKEKAKEFILHYDQLYGTHTYGDFMVENITPSIGVIIKYQGKIRPPGNLVTVVIYPINNQTKKHISTINNQDITQNTKFYLITDDILKELGLLEGTNYVTDGLYIESYDRANKDISKDKYVIKLTQAELNNALNLKASQ